MERCVRMDYKGCRTLVPIMHSFCVEFVTESFREVKTLLDTSIKQPGHKGTNVSHGLVHYLQWGTSSFGWLYFNGSMVCVCVYVCV